MAEFKFVLMAKFNPHINNQTERIKITLLASYSVLNVFWYIWKTHRRVRESRTQ